MIVLGIIALVLCVPLLIGGIALAVIFGTDGTYTTGNERISTDTRALVSAVADISSDSPVDRDLAGVRLLLDLTSTSEKPLFVGVGRAGDVSRYLDNVNIERIDNFELSPFRYSSTPLPGTAVPEPPAEQTFWVARSVGTGEQSLSWRLRTGTYQVVVMNADGSAGVNVTGSIGIKIPWIFWVALGLLIVGVILLVGGVLLVVFGAKRRRVKGPPGQLGQPVQPGQAPYGTVPVGYSPVPGQGFPPPATPGASPPWAPPPGSGVAPGQPLPPPAP